MKKHFKLYHLILVASILIFIIGSCFYGNTAADIHLHDTYFIVPQAVAFKAVAAILFILWFIYLVCNNFLIYKRLSTLHIILTIICICFLCVSPMLFIKSNNGIIGIPRRYYDYNRSKYMCTLPYSVMLSIIILVLSQILFILNLVLSIYKNTSKNKLIHI